MSKISTFCDLQLKKETNFSARGVRTIQAVLQERVSLFCPTAVRRTVATMDFKKNNRRRPRNYSNSVVDVARSRHVVSHYRSWLLFYGLPALQGAFPVEHWGLCL